MQEIKKLGIWSVGKLSILFGIVFGLFTATYTTLVLPAIINSNPELAGQVSLSAEPMIIVFVSILLVYIIVSFISGIVSAAIYNLFAKWVGGIELELEEKHHV